MTVEGLVLNKMTGGAQNAQGHELLLQDVTVSLQEQRDFVDNHSARKRGVDVVLVQKKRTNYFYVACIKNKAIILTIIVRSK